MIASHHLIPIPPGFDPRGLDIYTAGGTPLGLASGLDDDQVVYGAGIIARSRLDYVHVSLDDPSTHDALWRWARERMGWPGRAWWEWEQELRQFSVWIPADNGLPLTLFAPKGSRLGHVGLPALADATDKLHAFAIVVGWVAAQPEVKHE